MTKVAIVTGGNRGIGFEACRQLAQEGFHVWLGSRSEKRGKEAVEQLKSEGLNVSLLILDMIDPHSIHEAKEIVMKESGRVDVLINNAGIYMDEKTSILDVPEEDFEEMFYTNTFGPFYMMRNFVPVMMEQNYGRVVNLSTGIASFDNIAVPRGGAYKLSKSTLNGLTRSFAGAVKRKNIKINSMCPGWVKTDLGGPRAKLEPEEAVKPLIKLATLDDDGPNGGFFRDMEPIEW